MLHYLSEFFHVITSLIVHLSLLSALFLSFLYFPFQCSLPAAQLKVFSLDSFCLELKSGKICKKFMDSGRQSEWYEVTLDEAKAAVQAVKEGSF